MNNVVIGCDETFAPSGNAGTFEYEIEFGTNTGVIGIDYNAYNVPDRFVFEWNGQVVDTGYVGLSSYSGSVPSGEVDNTGSPSTGSGQIRINKDSAFPTTAKVYVYGVSGTGWKINGVCVSD